MQSVPLINVSARCVCGGNLVVQHDSQLGPPIVPITASSNGVPTVETALLVCDRKSQGCQFAESFRLTVMVEPAAQTPCEVSEDVS